MSGKRPIVLCILDGLGVAEPSEGNAFTSAETPTLDALLSEHPCTTLMASGPAVGLPEGSVGHGEVGYMTIGAGRVVPTTKSRLDATLEKRKLSFVPMLDQTVRICMYDECPVHLIGTVGDGAVHADMNHLHQLIDTFAFNDIPIVIHAILDGRDTEARSAMDHLDRLQGYIEDRNAKIGTVIGSHYAMDKNERWDRTYQAFHAMVRDRQLGPAALTAETPYDAVSMAHLKDLGDAFVEPTRIGDYVGFNGDYLCDFSSQVDVHVWEWTGLDVGLAFNHRGDGLRQLVAMLARQDIPEYVAEDLLMDRQFPVRGFREHCLATTTSHGDAIEVPVLFPPEPLEATLAEVLSASGVQQFRCGETEKRAHVTAYFNGGREEPFAGETRKLVRSPRLADTYDDKPEMSASKVADAAVKAIEEGEAEFIVVSFANPDMMTTMKGAKRALAAVDEAVKRIDDAVRAKSGILVITSDHGNCEALVDGKGGRLRAHTANPVPLIVVNGEAGERESTKLREGGSLVDVAPTLLDLFDIDKPADMTGSSLRVRS